MPKTLKSSLLSILFDSFYVLVDKIGQQTAYSLNRQAHYLLHPSLFFCYNLAVILILTQYAVQRKSIRHCAQYATKIQAYTNNRLGQKTAIDVLSRNVLIYSTLQYMAFCLSICRILHDKRWPFAMQKATFHQLCYYLYLSRRMSAAIVPACPGLGLVAHV